MPGTIQSPNPVVNFRGLNEKKLLGGDIHETSTLENVNVRNGVVSGRKGIDEWDGIVTVSPTTPIIGLMDHYLTSTAASSLLRMTPTKVEKWNAGTHAWDDVTGVALNGLSTTLPQFCNIAELNSLGFTNEGRDRPRKYTGTGNTVVLGGTPPFAKAIEFYVGFLCLGNCSNDGTTFNGIRLVLSDDPDNSWVECNDTEVYVVEMFLDETPGDILALKVRGNTLMAYKTDGIVAVKFTGGKTRFQRQKLDFPLGILAPLSLQSLGEFGDIFLATDRNLYINKGNGVVEPLPLVFQKTLKAIPEAVVPTCRSEVDYTTETYMLGVRRFGSTALDSILEYNYRTGEATRKRYPVEFTAMLGYKQNRATDYRRVAATSNLVFQLETGTDDNGTSVSRIYDTDWSQLGAPGNKWVSGAEFSFTKARDCRVRISVAVDRSSKFSYPKWFDLRGDDPDEDEVRVSYGIESPVFGTWFNFRVEMFHDAATNVCELIEFTPELTPVSSAAEDTPNLTSPSKI